MGWKIGLGMLVVGALLIPLATQGVEPTAYVAMFCLVVGPIVTGVGLGAATKKRRDQKFVDKRSAAQDDFMK